MIAVQPKLLNNKNLEYPQLIIAENVSFDFNNNACKKISYQKIPKNFILSETDVKYDLIGFSLQLPRHFGFYFYVENKPIYFEKCKKKYFTETEFKDDDLLDVNYLFYFISN